MNFARQATKVVVALLALAFVAALGGISLGITGAILAAALHIIGFVSMGTAQAIFWTFFTIGALVGVLKGLIGLLVLEEP